MIRKIVLQNFMAHESTELLLGEGLNVLVGPNNIGKSTIAVALKTLARNGNSSFVQRHEAKECSVIVTTSEGHTIQWQKKKSPSYIINGEVKDRLGRGGTPPELDETLRLAPVEFEDKDFEPHFGEQKSPIFLINRPPSQIAQFFSTTSDAERLVAMQRLHQKKKGDAQSQLKFLEEANQSLAKQSELLAEVPGLANGVTELEGQLAVIADVDAEMQSLLSHLEKWKKETVESSFQHQILTSLDRLIALPEFYDDEPLEVFNALIGTVERELERVGKMASELAALDTAPPTYPTETLSELCVQLERLIQRKSFWTNRCDCISHLAEPPDVFEEPELANYVTRYEELFQTAEQSRRQTSEFSNLQMPSQPTDTDSLQMLIDAMYSHEQASDALLSSQHEIDQESTRLDRLLAEWLSINPTCPTCGTHLTIEMMRNRHHHAGEFR